MFYIDDGQLMELILILLHCFKLSNRHTHPLWRSPPDLRALKLLQTNKLATTPQAPCVVYVVNNMQ